MARAGRGSYSSSSNCLCSLCTSLLKLILALGITIFFFWLIYRPSKLKVDVDSASLTRFSLINITTLGYNLTLDISVRNPNSRVSFYYDYIEAQAAYSGASFGVGSDLPTFFQHHKNTTVLHPAFSGQASGLDSSVLAETFHREEREGFFHVDVKVFGKVRVKVMFFKFGHFKPTFDCNVKLPGPSSSGSAGGGGGGGFERTGCHVDF